MAKNGTPRKVSGIRRAVAFNQKLAAGTAEAISAGYEAFAKALDEGDLDEPGLKNPILKGSLAGWIAATDKSLDTLLSAAEDFMFPSAKNLQRFATEASAEDLKALMDLVTARMAALKK